MLIFYGTDSEAAIALDNAFNGLQAALSGLLRDTESLEREDNNRQLIFGSDGMLTGAKNCVDVRELTDDPNLADYDQLIFARGYVDDLPHAVDELYDWHHKAQELVDKLPISVAKRLGELTNVSNWADRVRYECLDVILVWPGGVTSQFAFSPGDNIPRAAHKILAACRKQSPYEQWRLFLAKLAEYRRQIIAIRSAFSESPKSSDGDVGEDKFHSHADGQPHDSESATEPADQLAGYESRAVAYFLAEAKKRPPNEIKKAEIIARLGCVKSTLSKGRAPILDAVMKAHQSPSARTVRRGSKDSEGNLEAYE